jgi:hypothetical protein
MSSAIDLYGMVWAQTYYDSMRRPYYHNAGKGQTLWEMPAEMKAAAPVVPGAGTLRTYAR